MNWTSKMRVFFPPISLEIDSATTLAHFWRLHFLHQWPLWGPGCWFGSTGLGWAKELVVWLSPHFRWSHLVENTGQTSVQQTWISFQMDQIAIRMVLMFRKASSVPKLRKMKKRAPNMLLVTLYPYPNYSSFLLHPFLAVCIIWYIYIYWFIFCTRFPWFLDHLSLLHHQFWWLQTQDNQYLLHMIRVPF